MFQQFECQVEGEISQKKLVKVRRLLSITLFKDRKK